MFGLQVVQEKTDWGLRLRKLLLDMSGCRWDSVTDGLQYRVLKSQMGELLLCRSLRCMAEIKHRRFKE